MSKSRHRACSMEESRCSTPILKHGAGRQSHEQPAGPHHPQLLSNQGGWAGKSLEKLHSFGTSLADCMHKSTRDWHGEKGRCSLPNPPEPGTPTHRTACTSCVGLDPIGVRRTGCTKHQPTQPLTRPQLEVHDGVRSQQRQHARQTTQKYTQVPPRRTLHEHPAHAHTHTHTHAHARAHTHTRRQQVAPTDTQHFYTPSMQTLTFEWTTRTIHHSRPAAAAADHGGSHTPWPYKHTTLNRPHGAIVCPHRAIDIKGGRVGFRPQ